MFLLSGTLFYSRGLTVQCPRVAHDVEEIKMWWCDDVWVATLVVWVARDTFKLKSEPEEAAIHAKMREKRSWLREQPARVSRVGKRLVGFRNRRRSE